MPSINFDVTLIIKLMIAAGTIFTLLIFLFAMLFRRVVATNEVHVIQRRKETVPYGRGREKGNVYYQWPSAIPRIGISVITMPTSIFDVDLQKYEAFDQGKVPFVVDVKAFFQIEHPETAAQRVSNFNELHNQLVDILRGAVRKILASADIEEIMSGRSRFGSEFTEEVSEQLEAWGVKTVKNIEFMDIRDAEGCSVIENIMAKKKSHISMESRVKVAENDKIAQEAEIEAAREVELKKQEAAEQIGKRTAEKNKQVGIAQQLAEQEVKEAEKTTVEKTLEVTRVQQEKQAEIDKNVAVINANKDLEQRRIKSEADKVQKTIVAEGVKSERALHADALLIEKQKESEGITLIGAANASAEKAMQMAPVEAQIELAKEIGENKGYQEYLLGIKGLEAGISIGTAKAAAMQNADMKIIANAGDVDSGMASLMDVFTSKGGTNLGSMLEAMNQTDAGKKLFEKLTGLNGASTQSKPTQSHIISKDAV